MSESHQPSTPKRFPAKAPCIVCKQPFMVCERRKNVRKCCSKACDTKRKRAGKTRACCKCAKQLPYDAFVRNQWGSLTPSCHDCYRPRGSKEVPYRDAAAPCLNCGKPFRLRLPASRMAMRKYCSRPCGITGRTRPRLTCQACHRDLPRDCFDYTRNGQKQVTTCRSCHMERDRLRTAGIGYMQSLGHASAHARNVARARGIGYQLSRDQEKAIYGSPCALCGQRSCVFVAHYPELDFIEENTSGQCYACARFSGARAKDAAGQVALEDVVRQAQRIVGWAEKA